MKEVINKNKRFKKTYLLEEGDNISKEISNVILEEAIDSVDHDDDDESITIDSDMLSNTSVKENLSDTISSAAAQTVTRKLSRRQQYKKVPGVEKRGRKSKYYTHVQPRLSEIEHWARNGYYEFQMYQLLGIGKDAFCKYKKEYTEFAEVLHKGGIADMMVENTAFKLATSGLSPFATFKWLERRNPERWGEKKDLTINGNMITKQEVTVDLTKFSKEELIMLATSIDETEFSKSKKTQ